MNETLKKYYGIFAEQLKKDRDVSELYRFEKISPECAYVYAGSEWSDGEYKRSVGKWQWGEDIRVLAMLVSEILLRALFMMPDGKELKNCPMCHARNTYAGSGCSRPRSERGSQGSPMRCACSSPARTFPPPSSTTGAGGWTLIFAACPISVSACKRSETTKATRCMRSISLWRGNVMRSSVKIRKRSPWKTA